MEKETTSEKRAVITPKEERILHTRSGGFCALCGTVLTVSISDEAYKCIGENAHICGERPKAARYNKEISETERNSYKNLIYLCANCHTVIDSDEKKYTVDELHRIKNEHEMKVLNKLKEESLNTSFAELDILIKYLVVNKSSEVEMQYDLTPIIEKIAKNKLNDVTEFINMGMIQLLKIEDFLNRMPDVHYSDRLTKCMSDKYIELKNMQRDEIVIFDELWTYASAGHNENRYRASALGIVVYFFEKCEVFEK